MLARLPKLHARKLSRQPQHDEVGDGGGLAGPVRAHLQHPLLAKSKPLIVNLSLGMQLQTQLVPMQRQYCIIWRTPPTHLIFSDGWGPPIPTSISQADEAGENESE